jgi:hypothetical protein
MNLLKSDNYSSPTKDSPTENKNTSSNQTSTGKLLSGNIGISPHFPDLLAKYQKIAQNKKQEQSNKEIPQSSMTKQNSSELKPIIDQPAIL